ncbi:MAG: hydrogenase iron-sulfur subunit [Polyangiaceae bacterium]|nr:hydrogenase iron-sulfur subunit [Polyangiaceae bacterium]
MPAEPTILAFACQCCACTAADAAGALHLEYPTAVRIIRLPCAGRVDSTQIMAALESGADAVMVAGCPEGDCHFVDGNARAAARVRSVQELLNEAGLEPERLSMVHVTARDGAGFARLASEATERAKALGPNPLASDASTGETP